MKNVKLVNKLVGDNYPCYYVAEIGGSFQNFTESKRLIDSAIEQAPNSLIVKLIKMKHQAKKESSGNDYIHGLDDIIHFLVTDEDYHKYKNTPPDEDIVWIYENSNVPKA